MALWKPSSDANLYAWYNQNGLGDVGDDQTTWEDQSGNGRDLSESGTTNPTISSTVVNGNKGIAFAVNTGMSRSSFLDLDGQDFLIGVYFLDTSNGDFENTIVIFDLDAPSTGYGLFLFNFSTFLKTVVVGKDSSTIGVSSGSGHSEFFGSNGVHGGGVVLVMHRRGDTVTVTVNGIQLNQFTESVTSTGNDAFHLGSYSGLSQESLTTVNYETVVMVGDSIPDSTRLELEGYLAYKFGRGPRLKAVGGTALHKYNYHAPTECLEISGTTGTLQSGLSMSLTSELTTVRI